MSSPSLLNWLADIIGCVFPFGLPVLYLTSTLTDQVRDDILSRISRVPVPAEFGAAEVPCRKMDEVSYTRFHGALFSEATHF